MIKSAQLQAEKRAAQAKHHRVGVDQAGMINTLSENQKEWKELKFHSNNSEESEREFEKLFEFGTGA